VDEEYVALLVDLHVRQRRQGPGGAAETNKAMAMAMANIKQSERLRVADIGCGTGASTLQLAESLNADIVAVDFLADFLEVLRRNAEAKNLIARIEPLVCSMEQLPFAESEFDIIWSEGAIYNMGFKNGVKAWKRYLKPGGMLVASEITWTTATRPNEIQEYWESNYKEIAIASEKIKIIEESGYSPVGYFVLPENCWLANYYQPLHEQLPDFLARHEGDDMAIDIADSEKREMAFYEKYKSYYSYGVYVAQKLS
jgi:ubiquinone/menaquinone biosynthesis C-methylase UbiE